MNTIAWDGETIDDLYDLWIELVEEGNRAGLLKELASAANSGTTVFTQDLEYVGPDYSTDEMIIMELAYGSDADKIINIVAESDDHEVGENLK